MNHSNPIASYHVAPCAAGGRGRRRRSGRAVLASSAYTPGPTSRRRSGGPTTERAQQRQSMHGSLQLRRQKDQWTKDQITNKARSIRLGCVIPASVSFCAAHVLLSASEASPRHACSFLPPLWNRRPVRPVRRSSSAACCSFG
jgi:hypothetical protein